MARRYKKAVKEIAPLESLPAIDADPRPTLSPYATHHVDVYFGNTREAFKVPEILLNKCSNLPRTRGIYDRELRFEQISVDVGHILIHFLFTDVYQCLKPQGSTIPEMQIAEFTNCVQAYAVAQMYNLPSLAEQAQKEIRRLGHSITVSNVLAALNTAYPSGTTDMFLSGYLRSRVKALFADPVAMGAMTSTPDDEDRPKSIVEILFETMVKLRLEEDREGCDEQDESEMTGPEVCDITKHPHDEGLDGNFKKPKFSPVLEEPCAETECPPEPCAEPAWVEISDQD
ncbi:hypothetical protein PG991_006741 [Apiospora marii]|uniref:BTB domain-containing protein n=1 Tax=Apiospora marii TaxID=335849 RepID=A0ABR1RY60_9PEZI